MEVSAVSKHSPDLLWLVARTGAGLSPEAKGIKATSGSTIRGMVALDLWTPNAVFAHVALDAPIAWRRLGPALFDYVFRQAGKNVLLCYINASNARSNALVRALGFRELLRVKDGWDEGDDVLLYEMRREHCRWLEAA